MPGVSSSTRRNSPSSHCTSGPRHSFFGASVKNMSVSFSPTGSIPIDRNGRMLANGDNGRSLVHDRHKGRADAWVGQNGGEKAYAQRSEHNGRAPHHICEQGVVKGVQLTNE